MKIQKFVFITSIMFLISMKLGHEYNLSVSFFCRSLILSFLKEENNLQY